MSVDVIFVVLLSVILGSLLFLVLKRFSSIQQQLAELVEGPEHFDSIQQQLAVLIQQTEPDTLPPQICNFNRIRNEFRKYIERESPILQCTGTDGAFVKYNAGYSTENGLPPIWITAWIPDGNIISTTISINENSHFFESHYQKLKKHKSKIETVFSFETIELTQVRGGIHQLRMQKAGIDLTQTDKWETEFRWLRENLEKLYWVLRVHDQGGWDS